jgi:antitoxin VapB
MYAQVREAPMPKTARIFRNNGSQAVRFPKGFPLTRSEVFIRKEGDELILSPRPSDWSALLQGPFASKEFMEGVEDPPVQERP